MKTAGRLLVLQSAIVLLGGPCHAQSNLDISGVRLWLERADAIRGPEGFGEDNYYTSYQISLGSFRNFTSNACWYSSDGPNCTQALDGTAPWDASAPPTTAAPGSTPPTNSTYHTDVLHSTTATAAWASCGQWLNSVLSYGGHLYGFVHGEAPQPNTSGCGYPNTHHKTMTLWTSPTGTSAGLQSSWFNPTRIIDSTNGNTGTGESGEGDCTAINDSTFAYVICRNPTSDTTTLARASLTNLTSFTKYDNGWGTQPGINGTDSNLVGTVAGTGPSGGTTSTQLGTGASVWVDNNMAMVLGVSDPKFAGLKASFIGLTNLQSNNIALTTLPDPLFVQEVNPSPSGGYPYGSNPPRNLYIYPSVISLIDGTRTWDLTQKNQFLLAYAFVPPRNSLSQRILAMRSVTVSKSSTAFDPQVLVALTTRYDTGYNQSYSSTQPVAYGDDASFSYPTGTFSQITANTVGYLVQRQPNNLTSQGQTLTKIVECRSHVPWPSGHPDHLVTTNSCDSQYDEQTVAGYSYPTKPATGNSAQIYRCSSNANGTHWVSSSSTCDGSGKNEKDLGWIPTK